MPGRYPAADAARLAQAKTKKACLFERQAFFVVILPQALRIVVPPIINDLISMLKDSSIVSVIGVMELLGTSQSLGRSSSSTPQMLVVAAVFYLLLSLVCGFLGKWAESLLNAKGVPELHMERLHGH